MVKKHSTGALTAEQRERQDLRYKEGHDYDVVIVGSGNSALVAGALLAKAGKRVCLLEMHDRPGGYVHSFEMGGYHFCAQVHYIWGCAPGGAMYEFLKHLGLEQDITFELMGDDKGYDLMSLPDGKKVFIPYGFDRLIENVAAVYPDQRVSMEKFVAILSKIREEMRFIPESRKSISLKTLLQLPKLRTVLKYRTYSLQRLFDECGLSREAQLVLCGQAGDFMLPPERLSLFMYVALFGGYNTGSYYPTQHFKYYVDRLAQFIEAQPGCHIYYETEVTSIEVGASGVTGVLTKDGKRFEAAQYLCNMDPQAAALMIGRDRFPASEWKKLSYAYSQSGVMVYLGLRDIDLRDHGFGSYNIWHMEQWDMNQAWREMAVGDFSKPWIFLSTPSLHTEAPGTTPPGGQILEVAAYTEYTPFMEKQKESYAAYNAYKFALTRRMLSVVEERFVPELREHIAVQVVGSPVTNEDFCKATQGNAYGSEMSPEQVTLSRLKSKTPWKNFFWCNASSGFAGVYGTTLTGMNLYMDLTGDRFYRPEHSPSDAEFISALSRRGA